MTDFDPTEIIPLQIKAIFMGVALLFAFSLGWAVHGWKFDAELKQQADAALAQKQQYEDLARALVKRYQEAEAGQRVVYRTIREKVNETTNGSLCLGADAGRVWNSALGGVPDASAGTPAPSPTTDTAVLRNAIDNFEQYAQCRAQLNALIDWYEQSFKE